MRLLIANYNVTIVEGTTARLWQWQHLHVYVGAEQVEDDLMRELWDKKKK